MLVLTRREKQSLYIDKDIRVRILEVSGGQVRIGIEAPKSRKIVREEILELESKPGTGKASKLKVTVSRD